MTSSSLGPRAVLIDDQILVSGYEWRGQLKALGGRWFKARKAWAFDASPAVAALLVETFGEALRATDSVQNLVMAAEAAEQGRDAASEALGATRLDPVPITKGAPHWEHQLRAYHFAYPLAGAMLAMDMGTGKSRIAVDLIVNRGHEKVLIVCPKSVVNVWPDQIAQWAGTPVHVLALGTGSVAKKTEQAKAFLAQARTPAVVVVNYDSAWRDPFGKWAKAAGFDLVIADESHKAKAPSGRASRWLGRIGAATPHRLALTGTPMPHSPPDIWAQYRFVDPAIFGSSFTVFKNQWTEYGGFENRVFQHIATGREAEFAEAIYSVAFKVDAADVLDLPPTISIRRSCEMDAAGRRVYKDLEDEFYAWLDDGSEVTPANALVKLLRLQQCTSGFVKTDAGELVEIDTAKREMLAEELDNLATTEPVVVFARFTADLNTVREVAESQGRRYGELSGRDDDLTDDAKMPEDVDVLGVQIKSGGVGVDFTRAAYCVFFSLGFSNGDYRQGWARLDRPGQTRSVRYLHLLCAGTVDYKVLGALESRQDVVEALMERAEPADSGQAGSAREEQEAEPLAPDRNDSRQKGMP